MPILAYQVQVIGWLLLAVGLVAITSGMGYFLMMVDVPGFTCNN
jgi:hypothetical protein